MAVPFVDDEAFLVPEAEGLAGGAAAGSLPRAELRVARGAGSEISVSADSFFLLFGHEISSADAKKKFMNKTYLWRHGCVLE